MGNKIISISGPSGVGKTTIANLIHAVNVYDSSMIISGDDAHKWERNNQNWQRFTHLNPEANNLEQDYEHLCLLKNNHSIKRSHYNHSTGAFDKLEIVKPKQIIIYEGLHALFLEKVRNISDLKIYVDTDEELKIVWKIKRDLQKRGYTEEQVIETIKKRMNDESMYIIPQKKYADVIVKFTLEESEGVIFEYQLLNQKYSNLFEKIKSFYNLKKEFIKICKHLNEDEEYIQNKGGNLSFKYDKKMLITSSGFELKNISMFEGVCVVESENTDNIIFKYGRPSMEVMAHSILGDAVIHTHPISLLSLLCSKEGKEIVKNLYKNYNFEYIEYTSPGVNLYKQIKKQNFDIIFCENHGLFVSSSELNKCFSLTKEVNQIAKQFFTNNTSTTLTTNEFLFPDAVVLNEHNKELNNKIYTNILNHGLTPKFLTNNEISYILNMEEEKYRINK